MFYPILTYLYPVQIATTYIIIVVGFGCLKQLYNDAITLIIRVGGPTGIPLQLSAFQEKV